MDSLGFTVFAGCRRVDDDRATVLKNSCSLRLQLVKCDVTRDEDVQEAVDYVKTNLGNKRNLNALDCMETSIKTCYLQSSGASSATQESPSGSPSIGGNQGQRLTTGL